MNHRTGHPKSLLYIDDINSIIKKRKKHMHKRWYTYLLPLNAIHAVCFALLLSTNSYTQVNLILNPGFEDTVHFTPFTIYGPNYKLCKYWANASGGTVDYLTEMANFLSAEGTDVPIWPIPISDFYNGFAYNGSACIGMHGYSYEVWQYKEYFLGKLSSPLQQGATYCFSMMVKRSNMSGYSNCDFGFAFSSDSIVFSETSGIIAVNNPTTLDLSEVDSESWKKISAQYIANGNERYIYLGSYTPSMNISCAFPLNNVTWMTNLAYYLFDDIELTSIEDCSSLNTKFNKYDSLEFIYWLQNSSTSLVNAYITIFDVAGRVILAGAAEKIRSQLTSLPADLYIATVSTPINTRIFRYIKN